MCRQFSQNGGTIVKIEFDESMRSFQINYSENVIVLKYLGVIAEVNYCFIQLKWNYAVVLT